jgi:hypothetical protein
MQYPVKEMGIAEILDQGVAIFRNHFKLLFGITVYLFVPFLILQGLLAYFLGGQQVPGQPTVVNTLAVVVNGLLSLILFLVVSPLTNGAIIHATASEYLNRPVTAGQAFRASLGKLGRLVVTSIYGGLIIIGGLILFVIPGIYFALRYSLISQGVMIDNVSGGEALKRSGALMKNNYSKAFVLGLLLFIIFFAIGLVVGIMRMPLLQAILLPFVQAVAIVLSGAVYVVFYFSTRCEHENFDLALLAQQVGEETKTEPGKPA